MKSMSIVTSPLLVALAIAQQPRAALARAQQPRYMVTDLDTLDAFRQGFGINDAGGVGGAAIRSETRTVQRTILWREGQIVNLGTLGGPDSNSNASGPNGKDELAKLSETSATPMDSESASERSSPAPALVQRP